MSAGSVQRSGSSASISPANPVGESALPVTIVSTLSTAMAKGLDSEGVAGTMAGGFVARGLPSLPVDAYVAGRRL